MTDNGYFWIITKDHDPDTEDEGLNHRGLIAGLEGTEAEQLDFRMTCEGQVIYEGRIQGKFTGFEPLDDYGQPNYGCDSIQYKNQQGEWEDL